VQILSQSGRIRTTDCDRYAWSVIYAEGLSVAVDGEILLPVTTFGVDQGETLVVTGPNGSGKTTLLRVLAGLQRPTGGEVCIAGAPVSEREASFRARVAALIGMPALARDFTLEEHLIMVAASWHASSAEKTAQNLLIEFGIAHLARRFPHEISSGQTQLFNLALTLARDFEVLLLDEPEQRLDADRLETVSGALQERKAQGATLVVATHHSGFTQSLADETLLLNP